ncbi:MAG: VanZ family protein [Gemmatimonadota bacterium]|nr:VanZ family protein [Gemmatimonadota bacterium]
MLKTIISRSVVTRVAAAAWVAVTLYETLRPVGWMTPLPFWSFCVATMAGVDLVQNLVLFAPLGWIAHRAGWGARRTLLAAFAVSAVIELLQAWVPGRTSTAMDIACNTAGAAMGWWMAAPPKRPMVRLVAAFLLLGAFLSLHTLNTRWSAPAEFVGGAGVWETVVRETCDPPARPSTVCVAVPNTATGGNKYVRVAGAAERTLARVQSDAFGRRATERDCVQLLFESTYGAPLHLRPPLTRVCGVADTTDAVVRLRIDPRLEHESRGAWTPTRVGAWLWPVWPFSAYRPGLLRAAGALVFVGLVALAMGAAPWTIPAGYLVMLEGAAIVAGMRTPGLWDLGWAAVAWLLAMVCVRADAWWRGRATA